VTHLTQYGRAPVAGSHCRHAATLVELIMGITVAMIVITLAVAHITRHQRAYSAVASALDLRTRLRDGSDILTADLRGISAVGDSLLVASDTAVEFYSAIGTSTLCTTPAPDRATLPPDTLPSGRILSTWLAAPDVGDDLLVFTDSPPAPARWQRGRITSVATVPTPVGCPLSAALLTAGDVAGAGRSYELTFTPPASVNPTRGAPVRVVRRVRYSVYRSGDNKWYLGYRRCSGACSVIQPVSGPYEGDTALPISFRYFTHDGSELVGQGPSADVRRVDIVSRAVYTRPFQLPGMPSPLLHDSTVTSLTLRNRR
jgi:hypothetical protein